jgi:hypothetical protein
VHAPSHSIRQVRTPIIANATAHGEFSEKRVIISANRGEAKKSIERLVTRNLLAKRCILTT